MASDACNVALRGQVIYVRVYRVISPEVFVCCWRAASPRAGSSYGDGADRDVGRSDEWHGWPTEHIPRAWPLLWGFVHDARRLTVTNSVIATKAISRGNLFVS